jgi:hypothetical protein
MRTNAVAVQYYTLRRSRSTEAELARPWLWLAIVDSAANSLGALNCMVTISHTTRTGQYATLQACASEKGTRAALPDPKVLVWLANCGQIGALGVQDQSFLAEAQATGFGHNAISRPDAHSALLVHSRPLRHRSHHKPGTNVRQCAG